MKITTSLVTVILTAFSTGLFAQNDAGMAAPDCSGKPVNLRPENGHLIHQTHQADSYIAVYDSDYTWAWDTNSENWSNNQAFQKEINYVYDAHHNPISYTEQNWNGSTWVNYAQTTQNFNAGNFETAELLQLWSGSAWVNNQLITLSYDANNKNTVFLQQTWNGSSWDNATQDIYTYDVNNNLITDTYQIWSGSAWVNSSLSTITYNASNKLTNELEQKWSGLWVNSAQYINTLDANNNCTNQEYQTWNGSIWVNSSQALATFDVNNNLTSEIDQIWNGTSWDNTDRYTVTYDANNNRLTKLHEIWSGLWINSQFETFKYDVNNHLTYLLIQAWSGVWINTNLYGYSYDMNNKEIWFSGRNYDATGTKVHGGDSVYDYFQDVLGINNVTAQSAGITVFPNPSNGMFTFQWVVISGECSVEIYNVLGEQVKSFELSGQRNEVDLSSQPRGIYLYRVIANNGSLIGEGKLVVQK